MSDKVWYGIVLGTNRNIEHFGITPIMWYYSRTIQYHTVQHSRSFYSSKQVYSSNLIILQSHHYYHLSRKQTMMGPKQPMMSLIDPLTEKRNGDNMVAMVDLSSIGRLATESGTALAS